MTYAGSFIKLTVPAIESGAYPDSTVPDQMAYQILTSLSVSEELYCNAERLVRIARNIGFVLHSERIFLKLYFRETRESGR